MTDMTETNNRVSPSTDSVGAGSTSQIRAHVTGWGRYVPSQVLSNADLEKMVETND